MGLAKRMKTEQCPLKYVNIPFFIWLAYSMFIDVSCTNNNKQEHAGPFLSVISIREGVSGALVSVHAVDNKKCGWHAYTLIVVCSGRIGRVRFHFQRQTNDLKLHGPMMSKYFKTKVIL